MYTISRSRLVPMFFFWAGHVRPSPMLPLQGSSPVVYCLHTLQHWEREGENEKVFNKDYRTSIFFLTPFIDRLFACPVRSLVPPSRDCIIRLHERLLFQVDELHLSGIMNRLPKSVEGRATAHLRCTSPPLLT